MSDVFNSIHDAIEDKLGTLKTDTLKEVYGYKLDPLEFEFADFPVAVMVESGNDSDYLSTKENMRVYPFEIYIFQEVEKAGGMKEAYEILRSTVIAILDTFDNYQDLGGAADWVEPAMSGFLDFPRKNKTMATAIITLKVHKVKTLQ
jgi:hypothetical protein